MTNFALWNDRFLAGAPTIEGLLGSIVPFDARLHALRAHPGAVHTAAMIRTLVAGSKIVASHRSCGRVQDPYALRCIPTVHGAVRDALTSAQEVLLREANSVTDNIAMTTLASISERRIEQRTNAHPASVDTIPTWAGQEDHVSMGMWSARKLLTIVENTLTVVAIELLAACQAIDLHPSRHPAEKGTGLAYKTIRAHIPTLTHDRIMANDIQKMVTLVHEGILRRHRSRSPLRAPPHATFRPVCRYYHYGRSLHYPRAVSHPRGHGAAGP